MQRKLDEGVILEIEQEIPKIYKNLKRAIRLKRQFNCFSITVHSKVNEINFE